MRGLTVVQPDPVKTSGVATVFDILKELAVPSVALDKSSPALRKIPPVFWKSRPDTRTDDHETGVGVIVGVTVGVGVGEGVGELVGVGMAVGRMAHVWAESTSRL